MSPTEGPDIVLEFSGGVMTIRTQEAVYQVSVTTLGEGARTCPRRPSRPCPAWSSRPRRPAASCPPAAPPRPWPPRPRTTTAS